MKLHSVFAAVLMLAGSVAANATTTTNYVAYTLSYDETTSFSSVSFTFNGGGGSTGFGWDVNPSVQVFSTGAPASATFALPDFTITANPGWVLSGPVTGFLGNFVFNEVFGATTSVTASGTVSVDGGPGSTFGGPLSKTTTSPPGPLAGGYFVGNTSVPVPSFSSFSFTGGTVVLTASGGFFSSVIGQPQNKLEFGLIANPVPEPETAALMLAGLLTLGSLARRRGRG